MNHPTSHAPGFFHRFGWSSAGLAGALMLAANVRPAAAQIVYFDPPNYQVNTYGGANVNQVAFNFFTGEVTTAAPADSPGIAYDIKMTASPSFPGITSTGGGSGRAVSVLLDGGGGAKVLAPNTSISASGDWEFQGTLSYQGTYGLTSDNTPEFVGFRMIDGSSTYYGWARISFTTVENSITYGFVTLYDFAYNSGPGASILAGQTSAIPEPAEGAALFGLAVLGLAMWRRCALRL
jgi:hypothetical protein